MTTKFEVGDEVWVDVEKARDSSGHPIAIFDGNGLIRGVVVEKNGRTGSIRIESVEHGKKQWTSPEAITTCKRHKQTVYHDTKKEWVCPWCDLDE